MNKVKLLGIALVALFAVFSFQGCVVDVFSCPGAFDSSVNSPVGLTGVSSDSYSSDCSQYYSVYETTAGPWFYTLTNLSVDWDLNLYSLSNFTGLIDSSSNFSTFSEFATTNFTTAGTTYVEVENFTNSYGSYTLTVY